MKQELELIALGALEEDSAVFDTSTVHVNKLLNGASDEEAQESFEAVAEAVIKFLTKTIPFYYESRGDELVYDACRLACIYTALHKERGNHVIH